MIKHLFIVFVYLLYFVCAESGIRFGEYDCATSQWTLTNENRTANVDVGVYTCVDSTCYTQVRFTTSGAATEKIYWTQQKGYTYAVGTPEPFSIDQQVTIEEENCDEMQTLNYPNWEFIRVFNLARANDLSLGILYRNDNLDNIAREAQMTGNFSSLFIPNGFPPVSSQGYGSTASKLAPANPGALVETLKRRGGFLDTTKNREIGTYYNNSGDASYWYLVWASRKIECGNGVIDSANEECDDGGKVIRDGCDAACIVENSYTCTQTMWEETSVCEPIPGTEGACCSGATCTINTEAACEGEFLGAGVGCSAGSCRYGACCTGTSCEQTTPGDCSGNGKNYLGDNSICQASTCEPKVGGCCVDGVCSLETSTDCGSLSGTYIGDGTSCDSSICQVGACCLQSTCQVTSAGQCGGNFAGNGTVCSGSACESSQQVLGACCTGSSCSIKKLSECSEPSGVFQGQGTTCETDTCVVPELGACCLTSSICSTSNGAAECTDGEYLGAGTTCSLCRTGACCSGTTCSEKKAGECTGETDVYLGDDIECVTDSCTAPGIEDKGACCVGSTCLVTVGSTNCRKFSGTYQGNNTVCEASTCGSSGSDGTDGTDGTDGSDGSDGGDGNDGTDGTDGTDGNDGNDGGDGNDGTNADSAIQLSNFLSFF